jgi:hypothetical protein
MLRSRGGRWKRYKETEMRHALKVAMMVAWGVVGLSITDCGDSPGGEPDSHLDSDSSTADSGSSTADSGSPTADSPVTEEDSGSTQEDSGSADSGECYKPPYRTDGQCTGTVPPGCSRFDANGKLICPTIPGLGVIPDPSGKYCTGDNVTAVLSDCGHICKLPNVDPCYDVVTGQCLEGC